MLRRQLRDQGTFGRMIGNSPGMRNVYQTIEQAAPTGASVLIWGESGTGKELVAQTIHQLSPRAAMPFVAINCAAIPETLLESEIFGHEKGAFTGAADRRQGCFELADRGTLFLDEIAEMTPATQVKLLRVLQERTFRRLGGRQEQHVDVRVIAATNVEPLGGGPARQAARGPLLPPQRRVDRAAAAARAQGGPAAAGPGVPARVQRPKQTSRSRPSIRRRCGCSSSYAWPGNVRELRNVIERATILATGEFIEPRHLPPALVAAGRGGAASRWSIAPGTTVDEAERRLIELTLAAHPRQQDARGRDPRHQPEDAAQQAEQVPGAAVMVEGRGR